MSTAPVFATSIEAEDAFYAAFQRRDVAALMGVWAAQDCVCIHPGGERLQRRAAIERGWREIFADGSRLRFELAARTRTEQGGLAVHCLQERIHVDGELRGVMLATNVYRREADGWRLLVHHASPDPSARRTPAPRSGPLH